MAPLPLYIIAGLLFFALPDSAAPPEVQRLLEGFLSRGDHKELSNAEFGALCDRLDVLRSDPVAEVRQILPLARSLVHSPNPTLRSIGRVTLITISLRLDSAELLAPDIPEIATWADDPDRPVSLSALAILRALKPKPPATLVPYLLPRLLDSKAPPEKLLALSGVLIAAAPDDPAVIGAILNLLQEHPGPDMKAQVVEAMGAAHVVNERTIALFDTALVDPDHNVRLMAVQSVGWQHPEVIRRFAPQLRKIAADPAEDASTRSFASVALKQINPR